MMTIQEKVDLLVRFIRSVESQEERVERIIAMSRDYKGIVNYVKDDVSPGYSNKYYTYEVGEFGLSLVLVSVELMGEEIARLRVEESEEPQKLLADIETRLVELMELKVFQGTYSYFYDQSIWRESGVDSTEENDNRIDIAESVRVKAKETCDLYFRNIGE